ncbi:hypothetical protein FGADI_7575 [Fusarium gaditjirri]|uniref:DUF7735 domain-containing protein n=1 Tax=Fusarium gaditjirri TaxID=282569 RepID=A0A8H4WUZ5_9HYPO|nr:hypothetical protein FGADI_7575 [Fusarium gaditjirri]
MNDINAFLFDTVQFKATREGLLNLQKCDMSRIASFVSVVTFLNPPSWKLPFETFEQILIATIPESEYPTSKAQLASAYASYIRRARDSQFLLEDPKSELRTLWTKTLKILGGNVRDVRLLNLPCDELSHADYATFRRKVDEGTFHKLGRHHHADNSVDYGCQYAAAVAGDQLFSTVISCLSASGIAVPQIPINHAMTGTTDCTKVPGWDHLDFTALEKLEFSPDIPHNEKRRVRESVLMLYRALNRRLLFVEWRHVFDAIRDHPNVGGPSPKGLSVEFESIRTAHWTEMTYRGVICQDSSIATERHTHCTDPDGLMDENYSLEKHFYSELRFKYNYGLRYLMDDWDSDVEPTRKLSTALLSYGDVLQKNCKWDSVDVVGVPTCTYPTLADWCAFSDVVPTSLLPAWSSLGSSALSWWAENKDDIISGAQECPRRWFNQMVGVAYAQLGLNNTITYGACCDLAKRHVEAHSTEGPEAPETLASTATSGQGATSNSEPTATETSTSNNTENTSRATRVEPWILPKESNLLRLPTEILGEIVKGLRFITVPFDAEHLYDLKIEKETHQNLKSLRLVHRTFAEFDDLNSILFSNICLEPTRAGLTSLQRGDFSRVRPHVHSVTFTTPPSWALPYKAYEKILQSSQDSSVLFWPEGLNSAYDAYMSDARDTQALLEATDGELKQAWTDILKILGDRLEKVKLLSYDCEKIRQVKYLDALGKRDMGIPWQLPRHGHKEDKWERFGLRDETSEPTVEYHCKQATAITGDKLVILVFTCLAASGIAIPNLNIQLLMTGEVECKDIPGWEELDFSKLKVLHISPEIPSGENGLVDRHLWAMSDSHVEKMKIKSGDFCHDLRDKCHSSIQHFAYGIDYVGRGVLCWPIRRPSHDFPELTHLTQKGNIFPQALAAWIFHIKSLRHLEISGKTCRGPADIDWRFVFGAIREHPNVSGEAPKGLRVDLDNLHMEGSLSYAGIICKNASIATKRHERDMSLEHWRDVNYGIEAHFYDELALGENKALLYKMGQWEPRDEDDESDSSEPDS